LRRYRGKGPDEQLTTRFIALISKRYNVVIFSNLRAKAVDDLALYFEQVSQFADKPLNELPISYLGSLKHDRYRKPHRGMWELYMEHIERLGYLSTKEAWTRASPFFCGDAAGREGDFAATDHAFAKNCGLRFIVPETLFGCAPWRAQGSPEANYSPETLAALAALAQPGRSLAEVADGVLDQIQNDEECSDKWLIMLVGGQASGKTSLAKELGKAVGEGKVVVVHREGMTYDAYDRAIFRAAQRNSPFVVIDGTHNTFSSRWALFRAAVVFGYKKAIVYATTPKELCFHLNAARCELDKSGRTPEIPAVAMHTYWKKLEPPTLDEADVIVEVPFTLTPDAPPEVTEFRYG
jgi:DNA 3'-phosphatase